MKELIGVCKDCLGCNKLENPNFTGVDKCEYCTLEQLSIEQMKMEGLDDNKNSNAMQKQKK